MTPNRLYTKIILGINMPASHLANIAEFLKIIHTGMFGNLIKQCNLLSWPVEPYRTRICSDFPFYHASHPQFFKVCIRNLIFQMVESRSAFVKF